MSQDLKKIIYLLHPLERKVLPNIELSNLSNICEKTGLGEAEVNTGLQLLEMKNYININREDEKFVGLDKLGLKYVNGVLPEITLLNEILDEPKKESQLSLEKEEIIAAIGILKRNDLILVSRKNDEMFFEVKDNAKEYLYKNESNPLKLFSEDILFEEMSSDQKEVFNEFKKRKGFVREFNKKSFSFDLTKEGKKISDEINKKYKKLELLEAIDSQMLKSSSWKNKEFRHYDVNVSANLFEIGRRHPMLEANNILRDVFVEMGFKEMRGPMVESEFWNFDVMWIPQDHPAREDMDTFYIDGHAKCDKNLISKYKKMHEEGIKKSHTEKGTWSEKVSSQRILRTHSTATSFRTLAELGKKFKKGEDVNGKYFYVANNFRNETIDATHLAEFYQAEGFIIGDDLSLADLMGFIKEYYEKLGIHKIKFKPTYNPYTEPSMEAHYYDSVQKNWYSLINSGMFREETLEPLGLKGKTIIAWGMGASRVAALLSNKESMRDITGATCDLEWLKNRPMMTREVVRK